MRMTKNKLEVLEALSAREFFEYGTPPYSAATVRYIMGKGCVRQIARTLHLLEEQGLVVSETRRVGVFAVLKRCGSYPRPLRCYWRVDTMADDRVAIDEWDAGAESRRAAAWGSNGASSARLNSYCRQS